MADLESYFKITDVQQAIFDTIDDALWRRDNWPWLRHSQRIAVAVLLKMKQDGLTQKVLAERIGCTQQYVSKILKGRENLSLDIISRLENALHISLVMPQGNEERATLPIVADDAVDYEVVQK
ncbi:MAG: helix-turn-helix transcriptional regulator [Bacteroidales bacterium]|nr:helix-turn-helix transcriptional regulator [Bacteroidales bacterium]